MAKKFMGIMPRLGELKPFIAPKPLIELQKLTVAPVGLRVVQDFEIAVDCGNQVYYRHPNGSFELTPYQAVEAHKPSDLFDHYSE